MMQAKIPELKVSYIRPMYGCTYESSFRPVYNCSNRMFVYST